MRLDSPFDLMGLYRGVALPQKSVSDPQPAIDAIFLYRRPILDYWCETGEDLADVVRHIVIHEIGHHFGFSDEDMERIEQEASAFSRAPSRRPRATAAAARSSTRCA